MMNFRYTIILIIIVNVFGCEKNSNQKFSDLKPTTEIAPLQLTEPAPKRLIILSQLVNALEIYKRKNHAYPQSKKIRSVWYWTGDYQNKEWIKGLAPNYIAELPVDEEAKKYSRDIFLYISNGANYKIIVLNTDDCNEIVTLYPQLKDRGRSECAYGYWTPVAAGWQTQSQ